MKGLLHVCIQWVNMGGHNCIWPRPRKNSNNSDLKPLYNTPSFLLLHFLQQPRYSLVTNRGEITFCIDLYP